MLYNPQNKGIIYLKVNILAKFITNNHITGKEFKRIRNKCKLTQQSISEFLNVSKKTIERWESSNCTITGPTVRLMKMIDDNPSVLSAFEIPNKKYPLRIKYMLGNDICTIIDVDENNKDTLIDNSQRIFQNAF